VDVPFNMRLHCRGLKPKAGLFLPDPNLAHEIAYDVCPARLIAAARVRAHAPGQLFGTCSVT
jgi:hypothetical protein